MPTYFPSKIGRVLANSEAVAAVVSSMLMFWRRYLLRPRRSPHPSRMHVHGALHDHPFPWSLSPRRHVPVYDSILADKELNLLIYLEHEVF